jgi:tripartite ATP-independent transporter DctM subunit
MGVIIPPSIMMVIFGSVANVSIGGMFLGGVIPGILIGLAQMTIVYYLALKHRYPKYKRATLREILKAIAGASLGLITPLIVVGGIIFGIFTPTEAACIASLYSLILGLFVYRTIKFRDLPRILTENALLCSLTLFCVATASVFGWLLAYYNVPDVVAAHLGQFIQSPLLVFLLINVIFLIVGTFLDAIPAIIILVPMIYPIAMQVGIDPIHLGVVVVINLAIGLITPPYGLCLLLACTIADISIPRCLPAVLPFFFVMVGVLLLVTYLPDLVLWLPTMIMPQFMK